MPFTHNSTVKKGEPTWGSVDKGELPQGAFAGKGDAGKKSTWSYPHHWIDGGASPDKDGIWTTGTMYLHEGGLDAAWAAANGARSGKKADQAIIDHLEAHRKALGKDDAKKSSADGDEIITRSAPIVPSSFDPEKSTCRAVAASENPITEWDWDYGRVPTVLRMDGCRLPANGQVPLLDSHNRFSVEGVIGSARDFVPDGQGNMECSVGFASDPGSQAAASKLREGHITDFSVGRTDNKAVYVPEKTKTVVGGREYAGPVKVVTDWNLKELSLTPIGADAAAKARAEGNRGSVVDTNTHTGEGGFKMDKKLLQLLIGRGLAAGSTPEEALAFLNGLSAEDQTKLRQEAGIEARPAAPAAPAAPANVVDINATRTARDQEILQIREACEIAGLPEMFGDFIGRSLTVDVVRAELFKKLGETRRPVGQSNVQVDMDERDKFRSAAIDGLILRGGAVIEKPAAGSENLRGYTLRELCRECLVRANQRRDYASPMEMIERAIGTTDLPSILAATANKYLFMGYDTNIETWNIWAGTGSIPDFKAATINRLSETDDLVVIPEGKPYAYGSVSDYKETATILTYGLKFAVTRQAIINDDLGALTQIPQKHGAAASRKVGDLVYSVLTTNANMADGLALFVAGHANVGTGVPGTVANLGAGIAIMKKQKDIGGHQRLNIRAQYFIAPAALEGVMEQFFNSGQVGGATATDAGRAMLGNPYAGTRFERAYDARLDDTSAVQWYLAGPKGRTVNVYFLNGVQTPYLETRIGWDVDGIEYKVRLDAVAKAVDWRALYYSTGA